MVDVSKIEVGDELDLRVKVIQLEPPDYDGKEIILVDDGAGDRAWIGLDIITAHHPKPKPLVVGDKVRTKGGVEYEIAAPLRAGEYSLWSAAGGYECFAATSVHTWERVS